MKRIESKQNSQFKLWKSLLDAKGIKKSGLCLVYGKIIVEELLRSHAQSIEAVIVSEKIKSPPDFIDRFEESYFELPQTLFRELDLDSTGQPLLCMKIPEVKQWEAQLSPVGIELLAPLGDPNNLGALIRSAAAFGASMIILLSESAHPFSAKVTKASSGYNFSMRFEKGPSLHELNDLEELYSLDSSGEPLPAFHWPQNMRLLVGEEGPGLPEPLRQKLNSLSIPLQGNVESLNATIAASIALYEYRKQMNNQ